MSVLFVDACVRENSRTRELCDAYMRTHWLPSGMDIKKRKLYREPLVPLDGERLLQRDRDIGGEISRQRITNMPENLQRQKRF